MTLEQIERERFEAWARSKKYSTRQFRGNAYFCPSKEYMAPGVQEFWVGWLARAQEEDKPPMTWREQEYDPEADR
jgi:hypothetical protein